MSVVISHALHCLLTWQTIPRTNSIARACTVLIISLPPFACCCYCSLYCLVRDCLVIGFSRQVITLVSHHNSDSPHLYAFPVTYLLVLYLCQSLYLKHTKFSRRMSMWYAFAIWPSHCPSNNIVALPDGC
ncbi:hypothetical protein BD309DRAFT_62884 [Dichomitus squalens]|nr:hypothetical protein BD309DRAFT_62884 [Dichomitus squalens]